jgi:hypothetical protein
VPDFRNDNNQVFSGLSVQEENFCVYPVSLHHSEKHGETETDRQAALAITYMEIQ